MVFFFKQKTAYDMRISDCSSDVCSSDLTPPGDWANLREGLLCRCGLNSRMRQILVTLDALLAREPSLHEAVVFEQVTPLFPRLREIGRAACRERVCQYV